MTATALLSEEPVLIPNREKIRALREQRGWSNVDEAYAHARVRGIKLSRQALYELENPQNEAGCRLSTLGYVLRLYGLPRSELLNLVIEKPEPEVAAAPTRRKRARSE
jgi:hypothetical protein